jgi:hypothetical protein
MDAVMLAGWLTGATAEVVVLLEIDGEGEKRGGCAPGSVVTAGEMTVSTLVMVRLSDSVLVDVMEPREDQPTVSATVVLYSVK